MSADDPRHADPAVLNGLDPTDPVALTQALVRCPSVTPDEGGAIILLEQFLSAAGFTCHRLPFQSQGHARIDNLFARIGTGQPHLCFAGHTDVVPTGDPASWSDDPFSGTIRDGRIWGRGSVDMKSGVACFVAAALAVLQANGGTLPGKGSLSLLITGDEEADAIDGTVRVLDWMADNGHTPDMCLVGEPTCPGALGEEIKIGRRGSLTGRLTVTGRQGHVAYQEAAVNPVPAMARVVTALSAGIDAGTAHFPPTNLEFTTVDVGNPATNVIPERVTATFNVRFNDLQTRAGLEALLHERISTALEGSGCTMTVAFSSNADAFLTKPGHWTKLVADVVRDVTGLAPRLSTAGGTSDARFVARHCPVVECGLVNQGMHQVDESVAVADLAGLKEIYTRIIARALAEGDG